MLDVIHKPFKLAATHTWQRFAFLFFSFQLNYLCATQTAQGAKEVNLLRITD